MEKLTEFFEQIKNLIFKVGDMSVCDQYKVMEKPHSKTKPGGRTLRYSAWRLRVRSDNEWIVTNWGSW